MVVSGCIKRFESFGHSCRRDDGIKQCGKKGFKVEQSRICNSIELPPLHKWEYILKAQEKLKMQSAH